MNIVKYLVISAVLSNLVFGDDIVFNIRNIDNDDSIYTNKNSFFYHSIPFTNKVDAVIDMLSTNDTILYVRGSTNELLDLSKVRKFTTSGTDEEFNNISNHLEEVSLDYFNDLASVLDRNILSDNSDNFLIVKVTCEHPHLDEYLTNVRWSDVHSPVLDPTNKVEYNFYGNRYFENQIKLVDFNDSSNNGKYHTLSNEIDEVSITHPITQFPFYVYTKGLDHCGNVTNQLVPVYFNIGYNTITNDEYTGTTTNYIWDSSTERTTIVVTNYLNTLTFTNIIEELNTTNWVNTAISITNIFDATQAQYGSHQSTILTNVTTYMYSSNAINGVVLGDYNSVDYFDELNKDDIIYITTRVGDYSEEVDGILNRYHVITNFYFMKDFSYQYIHAYRTNQYTSVTITNYYNVSGEIDNSITNIVVQYPVTYSFVYLTSEKPTNIIDTLIYNRSITNITDIIPYNRYVYEAGSAYMFDMHQDTTTNWYFADQYWDRSDSVSMAYHLDPSKQPTIVTNIDVYGKVWPSGVHCIYAYKYLPNEMVKNGTYLLNKNIKIVPRVACYGLTLTESCSYFNISNTTSYLPNSWSHYKIGAVHRPQKVTVSKKLNDLEVIDYGQASTNFMEFSSTSGTYLGENDIYNRIIILDNNTDSFSLQVSSLITNVTIEVLNPLTKRLVRSNCINELYEDIALIGTTNAYHGPNGGGFILYSKDINQLNKYEIFNFKNENHNLRSSYFDIFDNFRDSVITNNYHEVELNRLLNE